MIIAIQPYNLDSVWIEIAPLIEKGLFFNTGDITLNDAHDRIESGEYLLICATQGNEIQAAIVVELVTQSRKTCNIVLAGGTDMDNWLDDFMNEIKSLAAEQGAEALTIMGRKGWLRKMKPYGFEETARILEVAL